MTRHKHTHLAAVAAALATAAAVAACGGSSSPPSHTGHTTASSGPPKNPGQAAYQFSACMRTHGVSNFPDPKVIQHGNQVGVVVHLTPAISSSPAFQSAQKTCNHYLPAGGAHAPTAAQLQAQRQAALAFANCMRGHGFPNFPDPSAEGQLNPQMVTAAGINLHQPALLHAGLACVSVTHGLLTKADIERAVNGRENGG